MHASMHPAMKKTVTHLAYLAMDVLGRKIEDKVYAVARDRIQLMRIRLAPKSTFQEVVLEMSCSMRRIPR
jgi:hypothetical protein